MSRTVHIASGDASAAYMLRALGGDQSAILVCRDVISCGPVSKLDPLSTWAQSRLDYWKNMLTELNAVEYWNEISVARRDLFENLAELKTADGVTVWLGTALSDQLLLAFLVQLADRDYFELRNLRVIQFTTDPVTGHEVLGVGILPPDTRGMEPPAWELDERAIDELRRAWNAFTAPDPGGLLSFLATATAAPTVLCSAFTRLLGRYPDFQTGLTRWETELLKHVDESGLPLAKVIGHALRENVGERDCVGDVYLAGRMRRLADARAPHPVLSLDVSGQSVFNSRVRLTSFGRSVVEHRANLVEWNGIDDWVGGVRLDSSVEQVWFRRGEWLEPVRLGPSGGKSGQAE